MGTWSKVVAGVVVGVAGTIYATNKDVRKRLPGAARNLPENVRGRFESAVSAARDASSRRREEILRDLQRHDAENHPDRPPSRPAPSAAEPAQAPPEGCFRSANRTRARGGTGKGNSGGSRRDTSAPQERVA